MSDNGRLETRYYKLEKLVKWEHIDTVNEMLMSGISPHEVSRWCKERNFSISHPKLYEYKEMLQEAISRRITVERLLGIGVPKRTPIVLQALGIQGVKQHVKNELEVLDSIIHLGMSAISNSPTIKIETALKAIELKNKLTDGKHAGLTGYGLDQLRELEQAKFNAVMEVVLKYVPEEHHEELEAALATAERNFYHERAPELLEEYEQAVQEGMEDIVVSDEGTQF